MKNNHIVFAVFGVLLVVVVLAIRIMVQNIIHTTDNKSRSDIILSEPKPVPMQFSSKSIEPPVSTAPNESSQKINTPQTIDPLPDALIRITKKPFGIFITPKTSPVQPERFSGYHTAVDLEMTPDEQSIDVSVKALCDGKLLSARTASGYGGVAIESCTLDGQAVTVVYGHIQLSSVSAKVGDQLKAGDFLANLGAGSSQETDGERKHLHLGIHKGNRVNILGYVQNKNQLNDWVDPVKYLK